MSTIIEKAGSSEFEKVAAHFFRALFYLESGNVCACLDDLQITLENNDFEHLNKEAPIAIDLASGAIVQALSLVSGRITWEDRAIKYVSQLAKFKMLPHLGHALVAHLPELAASPLKPEALDAWHAGWVAAGKGHPELDLPLRLLKTGLIYYRTQDEGELLRLPSEERKLLRQAIKLPDEPTT